MVCYLVLVGFLVINAFAFVAQLIFAGYNVPNQAGVALINTTKSNNASDPLQISCSVEIYLSNESEYDTEKKHFDAYTNNFYDNVHKLILVRSQSSVDVTAGENVTENTTTATTAPDSPTKVDDDRNFSIISHENYTIPKDLNESTNKSINESTNKPINDSNKPINKPGVTEKTPKSSGYFLIGYLSSFGILIPGIITCFCTRWINVNPKECPPNDAKQVVNPTIKSNFKKSVWQKCPANVNENRKYDVSANNNNRVVTKINGDCGHCTIIGDMAIPPNKVTSWNIKILKSVNDDGDGIFIGVAPFDIDQNNSHNYNNCGWYLRCHYSTLWSGPPHNYVDEEYGPRKEEGGYVQEGDSVGVVMDTTKGELSFVLSNVNLGVAYDGIPLDKPLVPCIVIRKQGDSVELLPK